MTLWQLCILSLGACGVILAVRTLLDWALGEGEFQRRFAAFVNRKAGECDRRRK